MTPTETHDERPARGKFVYPLGIAFMILMAVMYIKADIFLGWLETVVRALFM